MNRGPLISIVIPFLNADRFLREAIESVLAQTYHNWELLLVDDGSTDTSAEIARQCALQLPGQIRYLEHDGHQHRNVSASRNLGISESKGKYIAFLDADDVWLPQKLEQQVTILESQSEAAMVYGPAKWWYSWTGNPEDVQRDFVQDLCIQPGAVIRPSTLVVLLLRNEGSTPSPSGILVRREVIDAVGGFDESVFRLLHEDLAFYVKVYLKAPVFVASECWYWYRQHADSLCHVTAQTGQYNYSRLTFLDWMETYLLEQGVGHDQVWTALQKELRQCRHPVPYRLLGQMKRLVKWIARRTLPAPVRMWLWSQWQNRQYIPPVGLVRFGSLRRLEPISRVFGLDRGLAIDRYYIEKFLATCRQDVHGHVLEIGDDSYTRKFGGEQVANSAVLHVSPGNRHATFVGDLATGAGIPASAFDCMILTQTFLVIYDVKGAVANAYAALKPGGVLLATFPGISQISRYDMDRWGDYWRFTDASTRRLFGDVFGPEHVTVETHGNVLAACAFLHGLAAHELKQEELDYDDPDYQVIITVRAVKPGGGG